MIIGNDFGGKNVKVWDVIEGPYSVKDVVPDAPSDLPEDLHFNLCKVEKDGEIEDIELFFDDFNSAYEMVKYFKSNIEPLEIEHEIEHGH